MANLFQAVLRSHRADRPFDHATADDIYYCYRLLLQREPDEAGWNTWHKVVSYEVSVQMLVDGFLHSEEFRRLQEEGFRPVLVELDTFKMYVRRNDFYVGAVIANTKSYEPYVAAEIERLLKPADVFVDLGANIGYFTLLAATLIGPEGQVHAFEPNRDNCELVKRSIEANGFANIRLYPTAVAEAAQTFTLDVASTNSTGRIIDVSADDVPEQARPRLVEAVVLDRALADLARIDVIKMDIEGAEPRAWRGMQQIIRKHRPALVFEFSPKLIAITSHVSAESFLDDVLASGYDIFILERCEEKRPTPCSRQQIMDNQAASVETHLDLVAYPR